MSYNHYAAEVKDVNRVVNVATRYQDALSVANVLYDLHQELDRPTEQAVQKLADAIENVSAELSGDSLDMLRVLIADVQNNVRFKLYPVQDVKDLHQEIHDRMINLMLSIKFDERTEG